MTSYEEFLMSLEQKDKMQMTKTLRNGIEVTAKPYHGEPRAVTYANRIQATRAAEKMGVGWAVYQFGRPFYVGRVAGANVTCDAERASAVRQIRAACISPNATSEGPPPSRPESKQEASGGSLH